MNDTLSIRRAIKISNTPQSLQSCKQTSLLVLLFQSHTQHMFRNWSNFPKIYEEAFIFSQLTDSIALGKTNCAKNSTCNNFNTQPGPVQSSRVYITHTHALSLSLTHTHTHTHTSCPFLATSGALCCRSVAVSNRSMTNCIISLVITGSMNVFLWEGPANCSQALACLDTGTGEENWPASLEKLALHKCSSKLPPRVH